MAPTLSDSLMNHAGAVNKLADDPEQVANEQFYGSECELELV